MWFFKGQYHYTFVQLNNNKAFFLGRTLAENNGCTDLVIVFIDFSENISDDLFINKIFNMFPNPVNKTHKFLLH